MDSQSHSISTNNGPGNVYGVSHEGSPSLGGLPIPQATNSNMDGTAPLQQVRNLFNTYCSTYHGISLIRETHLSLLVRILQLLALIAALKAICIKKGHLVRHDLASQCVPVQIVPVANALLPLELLNAVVPVFVLPRQVISLFNILCTIYSDNTFRTSATNRMSRCSPVCPAPLSDRW